MIDVATLPSMPLAKHKTIPPISAIYFCLDEVGQILYIGKTKNLLIRWLNHHRYTQLEELGNVSLAWFPCEIEALKETENQLIEVFKPILNSQSNPYPKKDKEGFVTMHVKFNEELKQKVVTLQNKNYSASDVIRAAVDYYYQAKVKDGKRND